MKKDMTRRPILVLVAALTWLALAGTVTPLRSQDLVCCDIFIDADGSWFGARRDCKAALQELSPASRSKACEQIRKAPVRPWFKPFRHSASQTGCCPEVAELCGHISPTCKAAPDPKPPKKCEKPTPWFDTTRGSGCKDVQDTQFTFDQRTATATVSMCGYTVFTHRDEEFGKDKLFASAYLSALKGSFPTKTCCETFREAARTGKPCDPRADVDCDGKPNQTDTDNGVPVFNNFSTPDGAPVDPGFGAFDENPNFVPSPSDCECKWELVKGTVDCSPDGNGRDFYRATWRCPSNGFERSTRKERRATKTWPCEQR